MRTDHLNSTPTLSTTVNTMSIPFFPFLCVTFGYIVLVTIFRDVHRPCRHYSKTFNNSLDYIYSFVLCLFDFLGMLTPVTIFGNPHRPCKHYSKTFNNSLHYIYSLAPCLSTFSGYIYMSYYLWKCAQTMSMAP